MKRKRENKSKNPLYEAIGFTADDLQSNRTGNLTNVQRQLLRRKLVLWFIVSMLAIAASTLSFRQLQLAATNAWSGSAILVLVFAVPVLFFAALQLARYLADIVRGHVDVVEGNIQLEIVTSRRTRTGYKLYCDQESLDISKQVLLSFKNHEPYTIYFTRCSKTILSAEWLS